MIQEERVKVEDRKISHIRELSLQEREKQVHYHFLSVFEKQGYNLLEIFPIKRYTQYISKI